MLPQEVQDFLTEVKAELSRVHLNLWEQYVRKNPSELFHYTSLEGLTGIVSSRKFFLSDMLASTDQSEIRHGLELLQELLTETREDPISGSFLESFERSGLWGIGERIFVHAVCFCAANDVLTSPDERRIMRP